MEKQGDIELLSYHGDVINGIEFTPEARAPDPARQEMVYRQSAATLNLLGAFAQGGYANLEERPQVDARPSSKVVPRARAIIVIAEPHHEKRWLSCGPLISTRNSIRNCRGPISIPATLALLLGYEEALTRVDSTSGDWYGDLRSHAVDRRPYAAAGPRSRASSAAV